MTLTYSRDELKTILRKAECCWTCGHNTYYDGVFHYCDLVRTKTGNTPCYPATAWQVCKHWCKQEQP